MTIRKINIYQGKTARLAMFMDNPDYHPDMDVRKLSFAWYKTAGSYRFNHQLYGQHEQRLLGRYIYMIQNHGYFS